MRPLRLVENAPRVAHCCGHPGCRRKSAAWPCAQPRSVAWLARWRGAHRCRNCSGIAPRARPAVSLRPRRPDCRGRSRATPPAGRRRLPRIGRVDPHVGFRHHILPAMIFKHLDRRHVRSFPDEPSVGASNPRRPIECEPLDHGLAAEAFAQPSIACSASAARRSSRSVRSAALASQSAGDADAEQTEFRAVGFTCQELAPGGENRRRELGRVAERLRARADAKVGGLELERHGRARELAALETTGNFFGQPPEPQFKLPEIGDVLLECGFGRHAFGLPVGRNAALVAPDGEPRQPRPLRHRSGASARSRRCAPDRRWCASRRVRAAPA